MGKAGGLLPSWYWPEGVQRYISAPPVPIDEMCVGRWARRYGGRPALALSHGELTYRELAELVSRAASSLIQGWGEGPRLALHLTDPLGMAVIFFAAVRLGLQVLLLDPRRSLPEWSWALELFRPIGVVDDDEAKRIIHGEAPPSPPRRPAPSSPIVALPEGAGLVYHSHTSLLSAAIAVAVFFQLEPEDRLLVAAPWATWEGLLGLLASLQGGGTALAGLWEEAGLSEALGRYRPKALWLPSGADPSLLQETPLTREVRRTSPWLLLSVGSVWPKSLRRRLRRRLGVHVLTVYGYGATGLIAASHPSWYLDDAVGIPMTGVDLVPIDPATSQPLDVPWEALSYAGIGVKSRALAPKLEGRLPYPGTLEDDLFYTGDQGCLDLNGMLYLLSRG